MIQYNYRTMDATTLKRAVDKASKANIGLVAMKTQGVPASSRTRTRSPKFKEFQGDQEGQAAIKTVLADERIHVVVSEMTNRDSSARTSAATASR